MTVNITFEYKKIPKLGEELGCLPLEHRISFAAAICERMFPNYLAYAKSGVGSPDSIRKALDEVWRSLKEKKFDRMTFKNLIEECRDVAPYEGDCCDGIDYFYEASVTRSAICYLLQACMEQDMHSIIEVILMVQDLLFEFILIEKDEEVLDWEANMSFDEQERIIATHPLVIREMNKQNEDLERLRKASILTDELLEWLQKSYNNQGKSLLNLS